MMYEGPLLPRLFTSPGVAMFLFVVQVLEFNICKKIQYEYINLKGYCKEDASRCECYSFISRRELR